MTALHWAAYNGHKEVAEMLMAKGADVNATDGVRGEGGRGEEGERERGRTRAQVVEGGRTRRLEEGKGAGMYASVRTSGWMCVLMCKVCLSVLHLF